MAISAFRAILLQRCPRCRSGRVFSGSLRMNPTCPDCGMRFEREHGYFLGAMYFSYGMAVVIGFPLGFALLAAGWTLTTTMVAVTLVLVLLTPALFRWSRVLFLHLDQVFDPL